MAPPVTIAAGPRGQLTWAIYVSLAPTWFDPADTQAVITCAYQLRHPSVLTMEAAEPWD